MTPSEAPAFDAPHMAGRLAQLSDAELDALSYGVVEMDRHHTVLRYNAAESRHAGLPPSRVVGRNFFREVAPCCDNEHVAQRYESVELDATIDYTFSLRMKPVPVKLRMLKSAASPHLFLLVTW